MTNPAVLTEIRSKRNLSQAELGRRTGLNHSTISRWERGERQPQVENLAQIAGILQLTSREMNTLFAGFGYIGDVAAHPFYDEPVIQRAYALLVDTRVPEDFRNDLRAAIAALVQTARYVPRKGG